MTKQEYERLKRVDTTYVYSAIKNALDSKSRNSYYTATPLAAYALYIMGNNLEKDYTDIEVFQNEVFCEDMGDFNPYYTSHRMIEWGYEDEEDGPWNEILKLKGKFSNDELAACVLFGDKSGIINDIPFELETLINEVIKVKKNDIVFNAVAGGGSYLVSSMLGLSNNNYYANFAFDDDALITYIRLKLIGKEAWLADNWQMPDEMKYNKIFSQLFMYDEAGYSVLLQRYKYAEVSYISEESSIEWKMAAMLMDYLTEDGKMAMVFRKNSISNRRDSRARDYFVSNGLIEQVICLPDRLYGDRGKTVLIIFSRGNKKIKFADLSKDHSSGRLKGKSIDVLTNENIDSMKLNLKSSSKRAKYESNNTVLSEKKSLDPQIYISRDLTNNNDQFESLKSLGIKVIRAAQLTALDIVSDEETGIKCIMPRNIRDGVITKPFMYVSDDLDEKYLKFKIRSGDLLITKNGNPFKVAVYDNDEADTVIANGNMYIVRCDYTKADPYYLKAFFESNKGIQMLEAYSQGNTVPMITLSDLVSIKFPYPSFDERQKIAVRCEEISKDIREMHVSIRSQLEEISQMF